MINRIKRLETEYPKFNPKGKVEIVMQDVTFIDDNGNVKKEMREVVEDTVTKLYAVPAYADKIEYMIQYGTLDKNNVVTYKNITHQEFNEEKIKKYVEKVILTDKE